MTSKDAEPAMTNDEGEVMDKMRELTGAELELVAAGSSRGETAGVLAIAGYGAWVGSALGPVGTISGAALGLLVGIGLAAAIDSGIFN